VKSDGTRAALNEHNELLRLATGWTSLGSNPGGGENFAVQTGPRAHPASCTRVPSLSPGVKQPGHGVNHPLYREVKERVDLYSSTSLLCLNVRLYVNLYFSASEF